jgi:hypothetical protein
LATGKEISTKTVRRLKEVDLIARTPATCPILTVCHKKKKSFVFYLAPQQGRCAPVPRESPSAFLLLLYPQSGVNDIAPPIHMGTDGMQQQPQYVVPGTQSPLSLDLTPQFDQRTVHGMIMVVAGRWRKQRDSVGISSDRRLGSWWRQR